MFKHELKISAMSRPKEMAPENAASLLTFIDYTLDDYLGDIAINTQNEDELFLAFLVGVRKR